MRAVRLRQILEQDETRAVYPGTWPEVVLSNRLPRPISSLVFNFSKLARALPASTLHNCPCRELFPSKFRTYRDCVYTGDLSLVRCTTLRKLLAYGTRFRTKVAEPQIVHSVKEALDSFVRRQSAVEDIDESLFEPWKVLVLQQVRTRSQTASSLHGVSWCRSSRKYRSYLQKHLVLVPTDKAPGNVCFVCKNLYLHVLKEELENSGAYEVVGYAEEKIVNKYKTFLSPRKMLSNKKLGHIYALPKMHKLDPKHTFIAALFKCTTTKCSKLLTTALTLVLRTLREKDDANIRASGIRRFFVVDGYEEVADFLHRKPKPSRPYLYTGDFSTMYTTIPHDDLIDKILLCLREAWSWYADKEGVAEDRVRLWITGSEAKWVLRSTRTTVKYAHNDWVLTRSALQELVRFIVRNTFVLNGGVLRRQSVGIPMGTNCAPLLANLYLYCYESLFIDKVQALQGDEAARNFHMTFRLIDDVLSVDNPSVHSYIDLPHKEGSGVGGIYPAELALNNTSVSKDLVQFLGMELKYTNGFLALDVYDKKKAFPFTVIRYPHLDSLIPVNIPYGVFTGLTYRRYRICSHKEAFLRNVIELAMTLLSKWCSKRRLISLFYDFLRRRHPLRWNCSVHSVLRQFSKGLGN